MKEVMEFLCHVWILGVCGLLWIYAASPDIISDIKKIINNNKDKLISKKITEYDKINDISFNRIYSQIGNEIKIDFKYTLGDDSSYNIYRMQGKLFKIQMRYREKKVPASISIIDGKKITEYCTLSYSECLCLIEKEGYIYKYRALSYYELSYISRKKIIGE